MPQKILRGQLLFWFETGTEGGIWAFQDEQYGGYDGLRFLEDGDRLKVFDKEHPERIVWEGVVSLRPYPVFTEEVFGLWIRDDQEGVEREFWARLFFEGYPAELVLADSGGKSDA